VMRAGHATVARVNLLMNRHSTFSFMAEIFSVSRVGLMREVCPEMQRYVAGATRIGLRNPLKLTARLRLSAIERTFCCSFQPPPMGRF